MIFTDDFNRRFQAIQKSAHNAAGIASPFPDGIKACRPQGHAVFAADNAYRGAGPGFDAGHDDIVIVKTVNPPPKIRQGLFQCRRNETWQDLMQVRPGHAGTIGMDGPFLRCSRTAEESPDGLSRRVIIATAGLIGQGFIAALEFDPRQGGCRRPCRRL